jgi:thiol-disulfide isomerase/thioredoxin
MQKKFLLSLVVLFSTLMIFTSCSKKDSGNGSGTTNTITSLTVTANKSTVQADGFDKVTFTVKDQSGNDVTSSVYIYIGSTINGGNSRIFNIHEVGTYKVYAKKDTIKSNELTLTVANPGASKYTTKIIADDFTGTWCGWCPRMTYKFGRYMANDNRIFTVGVHNGDAYALSSIESSLRSKFGVSGFPTVVINRNREFNEDGNITSVADSTDFGTFLRERMVLGLAINSTVSGGMLNITTKVGFDTNIEDDLKLVVLVVEDGLIKSQSNYYHNYQAGNPYYNLGNPMSSFEHNGVLRATPTGIFGETITKSAQTKNNTYTATHSVSLSGMNSSNVKVVAFVTYADGNIKKGVLNAQWATAGINKNFD